MSCGHQEATAIHPVPVERFDRGFRLVVLREFRSETAPPAFALIEQHFLRSPERRNRHGVSFAVTFRPEIMDWLIADLGRPSQRTGDGPSQRNPRWPTLQWLCRERDWPDGLRSLEWLTEVTFADEASWLAFAQRWQRRLDGEYDTL